MCVCVCVYIYNLQLKIYLQGVLYLLLADCIKTLLMTLRINADNIPAHCSRQQGTWKKKQLQLLKLCRPVSGFKALKHDIKNFIKTS